MAKRSLSVELSDNIMKQTFLRFYLFGQTFVMLKAVFSPNLVPGYCYNSDDYFINHFIFCNNVTIKYND